MSMRKIYIVEDDADIRDIVVYALHSAGFEAQGFEKSMEFWPALEKSLPDLLLLDIMLPGEDGLSILKKLRGDTRTKPLPIIMLTAKGSEFDKVKGLDAGADDYIAKPFGVMELISRVNALLRRIGHHADTLTYQNITLDSARRAVLIDCEKVSLTYKEYELLYYLLLNAELVCSRDKILEAVWGFDFEGESRTLDMHIRTLRQKLGPAGEHIKTVRNVGYQLGE